ncbi:tRNA (adenosine(37)-N6)-threonylcarbamoyltransferase complex dimerization subunit type 1 TsaB [Candidatus Saccharibacteria bacterium RIFCSPHIGHO2_02_FULL_47_12]|nr:MAG: tRNA (adenosine(37)-N6)-threonylcarbamoyltransferase complex dimerization subunit type 1 TsaB [Candidatus Saccharibacteria bacterium RIFCSPHIGHO2_02_FULL_47_12]
MIILTIRTDKPEAEIGLYDDNKQLAYETWQAHRELSETLHQKIATILQKSNKDWQDIQGVVCFKGPGSFTGLRIGLTVGNALAYGLGAPIVSANGEDWVENGIKKLQKEEDEKIALPKYGSDPHITKPKK